MLSNYLKQTFLFILLVLLQVLVLRQISFLSYATPFLFIYFIIQLPIAINRNLILLLAFLLGFTIDLFCYTPGVNASALVFVAFFRRHIQGLFFSREDFDNINPKMSNLGTAFVWYAGMMILVHHTLLILVESFSTLNIGLLLMRITFSSALTFVLVLGIEGFSSKKSK